MAEAYTSNNRVERLVFSGSLAIMTISDNSKSFVHNLGYVPYIRAFATYPNGKISDARRLGPSPDTNIEITVSNTTTTLTFEVFDNTFSDRSMSVHYKIYAEEVT